VAHARPRDCAHHFTLELLALAAPRVTFLIVDKSHSERP
jgi:hypothetical protein